MAPELLQCEAHGTPTRLRCAEAGCDKPICPQCLVKTSVGLKCQEHAQAIAPKFDRRAQRSVIGAVALVAVAVEKNIIEKSGAWYSYNNERIGQGRENARRFLTENAEIAQKIDDEIRGKVASIEVGVEGISEAE